MKPVKILLLLMLIPIVYSEPLPMCEATREIFTNCTMITPTLTGCPSFNYTVFNTSGVLELEKNLTSLGNNLYSLNFTQGKGDYVVKLCDQTTREIRVKEEDDGKLIIAMIILMPIILGIFFMWWASNLSEEHWPMRLFLSFLTFAAFFSSMHFGLLGLVKFYDFPELESIMGLTVNWVGWVFRATMAYFFMYIIYKVLKVKKESKEERMNY